MVDRKDTSVSAIVEKAARDAADYSRRGETLESLSEKLASSDLSWIFRHDVELSCEILASLCGSSPSAG